MLMFYIFYSSIIQKKSLLFLSYKMQTKRKNSIKRRNTKTQKRNVISQRGGVLYSQRPAYITHQQYLDDRDDERHFYSFEAYHKLLPEEEGKRKQKAANNQRLANNLRLKTLLESPDRKISQWDYNKLTPSEKLKWVFDHSEGPQWDSTDYYRRKTDKDRRNELERQAMLESPDRKISQWEYNELNSIAKSQWVFDHSEGPQQDSTDYYRRK